MKSSEARVLWSLAFSKNVPFLFLSSAAQSQFYKLGNRDWLAYDSSTSYPSPGTGCFHPDALHIKTVMSDSSSIWLWLWFSSAKLWRKKNKPWFQHCSRDQQSWENLPSLLQHIQAWRSQPTLLGCFPAEWISGVN